MHLGARLQPQLQVVPTALGRASCRLPEAEIDWSPAVVSALVSHTSSQTMGAWGAWLVLFLTCES